MEYNLKDKKYLYKIILYYIIKIKVGIKKFR
jgi:hypothetical protein